MDGGARGRSQARPSFSDSVRRSERHLLAEWRLDRVRVERVGPQRSVRPTVSEAGGTVPISRDGGRAPRWRADGKELFFLAPDGTLMAAASTRRRLLRDRSPPALPDRPRRIVVLPPVRRRQRRPAVSYSGTARGVGRNADHRGLELASDSAEVTKGASHRRIVLGALTLSAS